MSKRKRKRHRKPDLNCKSRTVNQISNPGTAQFDIRLDKLPAGYSAHACKPEEQVDVILTEFCSSEDGDVFVGRLDGFPGLFLNHIWEQHKTIVWPSSIAHMIGIVRNNRSASVYINSPARFKAQLRDARPRQAGTLIRCDEISDISALVFDGVDFPPDSGVFVVFSAGWRKGFYYDFRPLVSDAPQRQADFALLLGGYYSYLLFRDRFTLSESNWQALFDDQWFPFISLSELLITQLFNYVRNGWHVDDLLPTVRDEVIERSEERMEFWEGIDAFRPHIEFFRAALDLYRDGNYISCISTLYPRIEGVLRTFQGLIGRPRDTSQRDLAATVVSEHVNPKHKVYSPLLPLRFNRYLSECYFKNFDPTQVESAMSRNTVCHGVAHEDAFNLKGATLGFLIVGHLAHFFAGIRSPKELL